MSNEANTKPKRVRVTLTVEAENEKDLHDALDSAIRLGRQQYTGISYGSKEPHGPRVSCRTTTINHKNCERVQP